uniref:Uncharacterized protein n=2 Tax=Prasinoderma coloniale TaxID=156133 RepID=A0A7R9TZX8_9VIRI|mmetsp:Transcript_9679/g.39837  ORF Transcript_9679/g.39837 Transcript_9679/m.39837 type:complete len:379 (+) Transcript_9679:440-1576(+)
MVFQFLAAVWSWRTYDKLWRERGDDVDTREEARLKRLEHGELEPPSEDPVELAPPSEDPEEDRDEYKGPSREFLLAKAIRTRLTWSNFLLSSISDADVALDAVFLQQLVKRSDESRMGAPGGCVCPTSDDNCDLIPCPGDFVPARYWKAAAGIFAFSAILWLYTVVFEMPVVTPRPQVQSARLPPKGPLPRPQALNRAPSSAGSDKSRRMIFLNSRLLWQLGVLFYEDVPQIVLSTVVTLAYDNNGDKELSSLALANLVTSLYNFVGKGPAIILSLNDPSVSLIDGEYILFLADFIYRADETALKQFDRARRARAEAPALERSIASFGEEMPSQHSGLDPSSGDALAPDQHDGDAGRTGGPSSRDGIDNVGVDSPPGV